MNEFDPSHRIFVSYIDKSREYYLARGYANPYRWAHHEDAPFAPLTKPLSQSRVGTDLDRGTPRSRTKLEGSLRRANRTAAGRHVSRTTVAWHKKATHTNDVESFLPIRSVEEFAAVRTHRSASPRFYGVPTDFSQRRTIEEYAPAVLDSVAPTP